jgi:Kef-type K+ transport system membrane component KefB
VHSILESLRSNALDLPRLAKFAIGMAIIVAVPPLFRRIRLPEVVGLLLAGIVLGPYVLDLFGTERPIADFLADIGKLLLMFFAGLETDLALFRRSKRRVITFGLITTVIPLLLGTAVGLLFSYGVVTAIVIGSLLASHTLLAAPIVIKIGANRLEPFTVTLGATVMSDTLSLVVFAMCVSTFQRGFSWSGLAIQLIEVAVFIPLLLFGVGRGGRSLLTKVENDEPAYFVLMFGTMALAAVLANIIHLPGIVGAFLAGLAVNEAVQAKPAKEKLEFFGNSFFIPIFFVVTGFLIDPVAFAHSVVDNFPLAAGIVGALIIGKGIAAAIAARAFAYDQPARMTIWSLTLPQVAATLAATLVGFDTLNPAGERLIDRRILDMVFVLILVTATLGPILTERYAPLMLKSAEKPESPGHEVTERQTTAA